MRHFKASVAINAGCEVMKLSRELGHANIQTTYNIYGHLMKESGDKKSENAAFVSAILAPV